MSKNRPRREFTFNTIQTSSLSDYKPSPTRDPRRLAMFEGREGIVIPWQQKVGAVAMERSFEQIVTSGHPHDISSAADLYAKTALGTAYHTFAQHESDEVMFRRVKLPIMFDSEKEHRTSQEELIENAQGGLAYAARLAGFIEEMSFEGRSTGQIDKENLRLGRSLATTGVTLAVIRGEVAYLDLDESGMQNEARLATQESYEDLLDLTKTITVRPTVAQLADNRSPLMQFLSTELHSITQPVYDSLLGEIAKAERDALRTPE